MSTNIRRSLGPIYARLRKQVENLSKPAELYDPNKSETDNLTVLHQLKYKIIQEIKTLRRTSDLMQEKINDWTTVISLIADQEDSEKEQGLLDNYLFNSQDGYDNFRLLVEDAIIHQETLLEEIGDTMQRLQQQKQITANQSMNTAAEQSHQWTPGSPNIPLPKLELPRFGGDPLHYQTWWDMFKESVHENDAVPLAVKFHYLTKSLFGRAQSAIAGIRPTAANYSEAMSIIQKEFGDQEVIRRHFYNQLQSVVINSNAVSDVRQGMETIENLLRQLEALGEDINQKSLIYLVYNKLPPPTLNEIERRKVVGEEWTLNSLKNMVREVLKIRISINDHQSIGSTMPDRRNMKPKIKQQQGDTAVVGNSAHALVAVKGGQHIGGHKKSQGRPSNNGNNQSMSNNQSSRPQPTCYFCGEGHFADTCQKYKTTTARKQVLASQRRCYKCYGRNHTAGQCRNRVKPCYFCKSTQHPNALCHQKFGEGAIAVSLPVVTSNNAKQTNTTNDITQTAVQPVTQVVASGATALKPPGGTFLCYGHIKVKRQGDDGYMEVPTMFDTGSSKNWITEELYNALQLPTKRREVVPIIPFGNCANLQVESNVSNADILLVNYEELPIEVYSTQSILNGIQVATISETDLQFLETEQLSDMVITPLSTEMPVNFTPQLLVGNADLWKLIEWQGGPIDLPSGLMLIPLKCGFLLTGQNLMDPPEPKPFDIVATCVERIPGAEAYAIRDSSEQPENLMMQLLELDKVPVEDTVEMAAEDLEAVKQFKSTIKFKNGKYEVKFPRKVPRLRLPHNYYLCRARLRSMARRFEQDMGFFGQCQGIFKEQATRTMIEQVPDAETFHKIKYTDREVHYLPWHAVISLLNTTTKVRIVLEGNAKGDLEAYSLNDVILRGPVLLPDLLGILLRMRLSSILVVADLEKAFLMVALQEEDRDLVRFLMFKQVQEGEVPSFSVTDIVEMRFSSVIFGSKSSPFMLSQTVDIHLCSYDNQWVPIIRRNLYVDNMFVPLDTPEQAYDLYKFAKNAFSEASMNLREWASNSMEFKEQIPEIDRAKGQMKILGLPWNVEQDTFTIPGIVTVNPELAITKRTVMQSTAKVYDPLGLAAPVLLPAKVFLQQLWIQKLSWDEPLHVDQQQEWTNITKGIENMNSIHIPRYTGLDRKEELELHTFADASEKAYACSVYARGPNTDGSFNTCLLYAKSRLAPVKRKLTIPKLELLAMELGVWSMKFVEQQLDLPIQKCTLWSDSSCCLFWLLNPNKQEVFVQNRLVKLRSKYDNVFYRHITSENNSADVATRGQTSDELRGNQLWWNGPPLLAGPEESWPTDVITPISPRDIMKVNQETTPFVTMTAVSPIQNGIPLEKYSHKDTLLRHTVYLIRFVKHVIWNKVPECKKLKFGRLSTVFNDVKAEPTQFISAKEMNHAEFFWDYTVQRSAFQDIIAMDTKKFGKQALVRSLGLQQDNNGLLRCYGRLGFMAVDEDQRHPKLLPHKHRYTELTIMDNHRRCGHGYTRATVSQLRQHYWVPKCNRTVQATIRKECMQCRKSSAKPFQLPVMPTLPGTRVTRSRPFQHVGLDYLGPVYVKHGTVREKTWVALWTCFTTRLIHLEVVDNLSTEQFLMALRRFVARRGIPSTIYCDNATNFTLGAKILDQEWAKLIKSEVVMKYSASHRIEWKFIPASAPWAGGIYEKMVHLTKTAFVKAVGRKWLTSTELNTYVVETEATVNGRPLVVLNDEDLRYLRPIDFVSPDMHHKQRNFNEEVDPKVGQIVLLKEDNLKRNQWQLARIVELNESEDAAVRSAVIKQSKGSNLITRPVNYLYPLEIEQTDDPSSNVVDNESNQIRVTDVETNKETVSDPSGHHYFTRSKKHSSILSLSNLTLSLVCFIMLFSPVLSNKCPNPCAQCVPLDSHQCRATGLVIYKQFEDAMCWNLVHCPPGLQLNGKGKCAAACTCPVWAESCSHYTGNLAEEVTPEVTQALEQMEPEFCSFTPSPLCSETPTTVMLNQVLLYDESIHYVTELQFIHAEATVSEYYCVGYGKTSGSEEYCSTHECTSPAQKLCYHKHNEIVRLKTPAGNVAVKAWGTVPTQVYLEKQSGIMAPDCFECSINCVKGGVELQLQPDLNLIEICTDPVCYKIAHPNPTHTVIFPLEMSLKQHEVRLSVWSKGLKIHESRKVCDANPFCEALQCTFCWNRIMNPHCAPVWFWIVVIVLSYFSSMVLVCLCRSMHVLSKLMSGIYWVLWTCLVCARKLSRCTRRQTYSKLVLPMYASLNQETEDHTELTAVVADRASHVEMYSSEMERHHAGYTTYRARGTYYALTIIVLCGLISPAWACSNVVSLTAEQNKCALTNQTMECVVTSMVRLSLRPTGQESCILLRDPKGSPAGTIRVEVQKISLQCTKQSMFYTRSFKMSVRSSKRCSHAGTCSGEKCNKITPESKVSELGDTANESPGHTRCSASCGCAACGCFYCTPGCLFYREYAVPLTQTIYEVFQCPSWHYRYVIKVTFEIMGKPSVEKVVELSPGTFKPISKIKLGVISTSAPPLPIVHSEFITDGTRVLKLQTPISQSGIGALQCPSKDKASQFHKCILTKPMCNCDASDERVHCDCVSNEVEQLFTNSKNLLPIQSQGFSVLADQKASVYAEFSDYVASELQVDIAGFKLAIGVTKGSCKLQPGTLSGCYNCLTNAVFNYSCHTDGSRELVGHVRCTTVQFSVRCSPQKIPRSVVIAFGQANVQEDCYLLCGTGETTFRLKGTLLYVAGQELAKTDNIISSPNYSDEPDYFSILDFMKANVWEWLISAVLLFIMIFATILCIPVLVQGLMTTLLSGWKTKSN